MLKPRQIIILAVAYFLAAKLGLGLAVVHPYATAVWPPTGIALAALLVFGRELWPGVALGAYLANLTTGDAITFAGAVASVGIAIGNTLEAVVGAYLVERFAGGASAFDRTKDVFRFAVLAALGSTLISASCGVASLSLAGLARRGDAGAIGGTWWIGDACGDLVLAPALVLWFRNWQIRWSRLQILEAVLAAVAAVILSLFSFTPIVATYRPGLGLAFLCTPALLWPAFRLGRRAAATAVLLVNAIALWSFTRGLLATEVPASYLLVELQAYMAVTSVMLVAVAAEVYQRRRQQLELRLVIDGMPGLVAYLDRELRYRFVNRTYVEWFGRSMVDIERRTIRELAGDTWLESIRGPLEEAFAGKRVTFERDFAYPDAPRTVRETYVPDRARDGSVQGIVILVQDITAEARGLRALQESEERFRRIVETAAEGIWISNSKGVITFANRRMGELLGYAPEEIPGRAGTDFIHPDDRDRAAAAFDACKQGDTEWREYRAKCKDGSTVWVQFTGAPIGDGSGKVTGVLGMCTDITTRKRAEEMLLQNAEELRRSNEALRQSNEELRVTKEQLQLVADNMAAAVSRCSRDLRYIWVSRSYAGWMGRTAEEIDGRLIRDVLGDQGYQDILPYMQRVLSGERVEYTTQVNFLGPGQRWIRAIYVPTYSQRAEVDGWIAVVTDITEEKRTSEQIRQTQRLESLGIMAGGIAHDFNNLLVGILGNASLALDVLDRGTPARAMLQDVISASERAAGLTRQLLAYAGKEQLATRPIKISRLVKELTTLLRTSIPMNVYLTLELEDSIPDVDADQTQLQQVVMNLVINAAEAIPEGTSGTVKITTCERHITPDDVAHAIIPLPAADQTYVVLTVSDTGKGMAPEIQARIFDPFFTTKFTGRGLGLSAVLGIVKAHQGTITLTSAPSAGTSFTLLLPPSHTAASVEESRSAFSRCTGGTILVVDDEATVRILAQRALEHYGYNVLLAENGQEAIDVLAAHPEIRAIVLDLAMPLMSGDQVAPHLRKQRPDVPIILSSGFPEGEAASRFARHGFTAFLQKPYAARSLPDKIIVALRNKDNSGA